MRSAQTAVWPAPALGLRLAGTLVGAPYDAAEVLDNFIPTATGARLRGGCALYATLSDVAKKLMTYRSGAAEYMFAATDTDVTDLTSPASTTGVAVADVIGLTSGDWAHIQYGTAGGQFLLMVNGTDYYHYYNGTEWQPIAGVAIYDLDYDALTADFVVGETLTGGTSGATAAIISITPATATTGTLRLGTITGGPYADNEAITSATGAAVANGASGAGSTVAVTGVDTRDLSFLWNHKARMWFVEKETLNAWYLPVNGFGGTATKFPLTGVSRLGGALLFGGSWSVDSGSGLDDICVFVTTEGEVMVYQGTDPGATATWALVGTYRIGRPLNKHSWFKAGTDFYIMTEEGIVSVSEIMTKDRAGQQTTALTAPIADLWLDTIRADTGSAVYPVTYWPSEAIFVIGVPSTTGAYTSLVANVRTGAWTRVLGWDIQALQVFANRLYFGTSGPHVFRADAGGYDQSVTYTALLDDEGNAYVDEFGEALVEEALISAPFTGTFIPKAQDFGTPDSKFALHARVLYRADTQAPVRLCCHTDYATNCNPSLPDPIPDSGAAVWGASGQKWGGGKKWGARATTIAGSEWQTVTGSGFAVVPGLTVVSGRSAKPKFEVSALHLRFETGSGI